MTDEEQLIPERVELRWPPIPVLPGIGVVLLGAFVALGIYSQNVLSHSLFHIPAAPIGWYVYTSLAFRLVAGVVPFFSASVMVWIAFISPRWSDRSLWSAAMIFTAAELAAAVSYLFRNFPEQGDHTFPNQFAVIGFVAYGSWLIIADRSALKPPMKVSLALFCIFALISIVAYPLATASVRLVDVAGSALFAGSLFAFGAFVAQRVGVKLFEKDRVEPDAPHQSGKTYSY